jgi:hypothetical protein
MRLNKCKCNWYSIAPLPFPISFFLSVDESGSLRKIDAGWNSEVVLLLKKEVAAKA